MPFGAILDLAWIAENHGEMRMMRTMGGKVAWYFDFFSPAITPASRREWLNRMSPTGARYMHFWHKMLTEVHKARAQYVRSGEVASLDWILLTTWNECLQRIDLPQLAVSDTIEWAIRSALGEVPRDTMRGPMQKVAFLDLCGWAPPRRENVTKWNMQPFVKACRDRAVTHNRLVEATKATKLD